MRHFDHGHPPKPEFSLAVGVIGHRPDRLPAEGRARVAAQIDETLALIAKTAKDVWKRHAGAFAAKPPALRLISALAEGADRMGAGGALESGYSLTAVLPFEVENYARDFGDAASKQDFERILGQAETTLVLPGDRAREPAAYETAGLTIVDNSDLLLAIWDGGAPAGWGGTVEFIERAARRDLPIIHIDANGVQEPRILWFGIAQFRAPGSGVYQLPASDVISALPGVIDEIVRPPSDETESSKLSRYFQETWTPRNWRIELPLLLKSWGLRSLKKTDFRPEKPDVLAASFESVASCRLQEAPQRTHAQALSRAALAFGWADALGLRYAQIFRGAYIFNFVGAALAVLVGVTSIVESQLLGWPTWPLGVVEGAILALIFVNTYIGRKRDWHARWRESREVAERLRGAGILWLVALPPALSGASETSWTGWYVRAQMRALGLAPGTFDKARLEDIKRSLLDFVESQRAYHAHNAVIMRGVESRIEILGYVLFGLAMLFAVTNAIVSLLDLPINGYILMGLTAALPALGAATFGIRLTGDFEGVAHRSDQTSAILSDIGDALRQDRPDLAVLRSRARSVADAMLIDVSQWLVTTEMRKLVDPV